MRIGLVDGLVEEAVARAYDLDRGSVREAAPAAGGHRAAGAARPGSGSCGLRLELMRPTNFMLAEPMETAEEIAALLREGGLRGVQVRRGAGPAPQEGRRGQGLLPEARGDHGELPGARRMARRLIDHDFMIDGEIVPFRDGRPLAFQLLQRRLRRIEGFEDAQSRGPRQSSSASTYFCSTGRSSTGSPSRRGGGRWSGSSRALPSGWLR